MDLPLVEADALQQLLPMSDAVAALEERFASSGPTLPDRRHLAVDGGDLLLMPAWSAESAGVKLVTVAPDNPGRGLPLIHGLYVLFDKPSLRPIALFDAGPLTALRTAAVSAVATRHLARSDAQRLVIFGAGVQARSHLTAMHEALDLVSVGVVSRTERRAGELVTYAQSLGVAADLCSPEDIEDADVICTCTTSDTPLFDGDRLQSGIHINAVGSYRPEARELDDRTIRRAKTVAVDTAAAMHESGDLAQPLSNGTLREEEVRLLHELLDGSGRETSGDITVFKSVGAAFEDLAIAEAAAARL